MILDSKGKPLQTENTADRPQGVKMMRASSALGLSSTPDWTRYHGRNMLTHGYERNLWVYRCSTARQNAASEPPLVVEVHSNKEGWEADHGHRLNALLSKPCPGVSRSDLVKMIVGQLDIQGVFYGKVVRGGPGGTQPLELWPLEIGSVSPRVINGELEKYEYTPRGKSKRDLAIEDVVSIRLPHPDSPYHGMPPMLAAGRSVDMDNEAGDWQKTSMQNRGVPDGVFELTGEVGPQDWQEARRAVRENYTGRAHAREPYVMANAKFHQMSLTPVEMDFINSRKMTREEICAAYGVPMPIAGILEDATLANLEASRKSFWRETMVPLIRDIEVQLTRQLLLDESGVRIRFDLSGISALQEAFEEKVDQARKLWEMGVPLSEVNKRFELGLDADEIEGAEVSWVATGVSPVSGTEADAGMDLVSQVAIAVHNGVMGREAAARLLARKIEWMEESDAMELLVESDGNAGGEG